MKYSLKNSFAKEFIETNIIGLKVISRIEKNLNGCSSGFLPVTCGVPQGSILGPVLFLLYVNDAQFIMKSIHLVMYADDMNLLHSNKNIKSLISELSTELGSLED